jgi:hypothetical protein
VVDEWPQTIRGPLERCFGFVYQVLRLRIIGKLVGLVSWYVDYHAAILQQKIWRSISLDCTIRGKQRTVGEGRVSSFNISLLEVRLQPCNILGLFTIAQGAK